MTVHPYQHLLETDPDGCPHVCMCVCKLNLVAAYSSYYWKGVIRDAVSEVGGFTPPVCQLEAISCYLSMKI